MNYKDVHQQWQGAYNEKEVRQKDGGNHRARKFKTIQRKQS